MTINNSTGARVPWLLLFWLAGIPFSVHSQERDKPKVSKPPAVTEDAGSWLLAAREGECAPTSILSRKGPEYSDVQSPYQLVDKLRAAGHQAEIKEFKTSTRLAVEGALGRTLRVVCKERVLRQGIGAAREKLVDLLFVVLTPPWTVGLLESFLAQPDRLWCHFH